MSGGLKVLIMAGGTGGHVYPALAVARQLEDAGGDVVWMGVRHGLEAQVVPAAGIPICFVSIVGLRGRGILGWLLAPFRLLRALLDALRIVRRLKPRIAVGFGGFVSGPGGLAAWLLGCPLLIHEQNAVPGLTNRVLSRVARRVMESFPGSFPARVEAVHTGNPVRADIAALAGDSERTRDPSGPLRVLVLGGSQGAARLNEIVPAALAPLASAGVVEITHQAGARDLESAERAYRERGVAVRPVAYIDDMRSAYEWADVAVCRSGASTVWELAAAGLPAVLVPFPYAVDDHQSANARYLADAGAALLMPESTLDCTGLRRVVEELGRTRERLVTMASKARERAKPDAAAAVAACCLETAHA